MEAVFIPLLIGVSSLLVGSVFLWAAWPRNLAHETGSPLREPSAEEVPPATK